MRDVNYSNQEQKSGRYKKTFLALVISFGMISSPAEAQLIDGISSNNKGEAAVAEDSAQAEKGKSVQKNKCADVMFFAAASKWPEACGTGEPPPTIDPRDSSGSPYAGHWDVSFQGKELLIEHAFVVIDEGHSNGVIGMRDPDAGLDVSGILHNGRGSSSYPLAYGAMTTDKNGKVRIRLGNYGYQGSVARGFYFTPRQTGNSDIMVGEWYWNRNQDSLKGKAIWRRRANVNITALVTQAAAPGKRGDYVLKEERPLRIVRDHKLTCLGGSMRGNCPTAYISIYGTNFAGAHDVWLDPAGHMEIRRIDFLCRDRRAFRSSLGQWIRCGYSKPYGRDVTGIRLKMRLWDGIKPGPRTLWVDGQPVPFELVINGYPEEKKPKLLELEILGPDGVAIQEVKEGEPFSLKATYDADHPDQWISLEIPVYASSKKKVVLYRNEYVRVFTSDLLSIEAGKNR